MESAIAQMYVIHAKIHNKELHYNEDDATLKRGERERERENKGVCFNSNCQGAPFIAFSQREGIF